MCARLRSEGKRLPGDWLLDRNGTPTNDPNVLQDGGSILPIGGVDYGHKGFALGLLVEVLTQGLSGYGRADSPSGWGAGLFVLAIAPQAFGPREEYARQVDWLANACLQSPPVADGSSVRLPGQAALSRKAAAETHGLALYAGITDELNALADRFHRPKPTPLPPKNRPNPH
jgi:L-lactate dehydrogenase